MSRVREEWFLGLPKLSALSCSVPGHTRTDARTKSGMNVGIFMVNRMMMVEATVEVLVGAEMVVLNGEMVVLDGVWCRVLWATYAD